VHLICLADAPWGTTSSAACELIARLAGRGHRVLYLNPPRTTATQEAADAAPAELQPGVYVVTLNDAAAQPGRLRTVVRRAARQVGLRDPVAVGFVAGADRLLDALPGVARLDCSDDSWRDAPGPGGWDGGADRLMQRIHEAEDRAGRPGGGIARSGPPHQWFRRRRASLSWKGHAALIGSVTAGWVYYAGRLCWRALVRGRWRPIDRILIVRPRGYLGDLVAHIPMLHALRHRFPGAHITLASQPWIQEPHTLKDTLGIDEVCSIEHLEAFDPSDRQLRSIDRLTGALRLFARGYDLVISGSTYFLQREPFLAGAPWRIGLDEGHPFQALNSSVVPFDPSRHEADNNRWLAKLAGATLPAGRSTAPHLPRPPQAAAHAAALRDRLQVPPAVPVLTVHPGSKMHSRRWPADRFAAVTGTLLRERADLHVVFSGVAGEAQLIEDIRSIIPEDVRARAVSGAGRTDLADLMALLVDSAGLLCNDTGSMHVARALGTPIVALMGPENHLRWGPYPQGEAPAVVLRHEVPCAPCRRQRCDPLYCLRTLPVEEVLDTVRQVLDGVVRESTTAVRLRRHSWQQLARAGFRLPLVAAVLFSESVEAGSAQLDVPAGASEIVSALQQQAYPSWTVVFAGRERPAEGLWRALELTASDLVLPLAAVPHWAPTRLDADVAALIRDPAIVCVRNGQPGPELRGGFEDPAAWHDVVLRRDALVADLPREHEIRSTDDGGRSGEQDLPAAGRPEAAIPAS
jgi:lipopolysaccharide heptosyltransferase II